jgi:hypothetical protein
MLLVGVATTIALVGCSDDGGGEELTREQAILVLTSQGYSQAAAECTIDNAADQDVDLLDVFSRDQLTQREFDVMATVGDFCVDQFGTTGTTSPAPTATAPAPG